MTILMDDRPYFLRAMREAYITLLRIPPHHQTRLFGQDMYARLRNEIAAYQDRTAEEVQNECEAEARERGPL